MGCCFPGRLGYGGFGPGYGYCGGYNNLGGFNQGGIGLLNHGNVFGHHGGGFGHHGGGFHGGGHHHWHCKT